MKVPSAVRNVQARPLSSKSVDVTWTAPIHTRGSIIEYTVYYLARDGKELYQIFPTDLYTETKAILTALKATPNYPIWMTAATSKKNGERSSETSVKTYENECASSPCRQNSRCKLIGDSYECVCRENWEGKNCHKPKGYTTDENKCLDYGGYISFDDNITLASCVQKCNGDPSCKSFEFGCGYSNDSVCENNLYLRGIGQCKRRSENKSYSELQSCPFDHYEKEEKEGPEGSTATVVPVAILQFLSVVLSVVLICSND